MKHDLRAALCGFLGAMMAVALGAAVGFRYPIQSHAIAGLSVSGTTITIDSAYTLAVDTITDSAGTGAVAFSQGATIASGKKLVTPEVKGVNGATFYVSAGDTAGDDVIVREGTGDGSTDRIEMLGGSQVRLKDGVGNLQLAVLTTGLTKNGSVAIDLAEGAVVATGKMLITELIRLNERASPGAPSAGQAYIYRDSTTDDIEADMETTQDIVIAAGP